MLLRRRMIYRDGPILACNLLTLNGLTQGRSGHVEFQQARAYVTQCGNDTPASELMYQGSPSSVWLHSSVQCEYPSQNFVKRRISARSNLVQF